MMTLKQILVLIGFFLFSLSLTAQEEVNEKGVFIGGAISYFTQNNTYPFYIPGVGGVFSNEVRDQKNNRMSFTPYVGLDLNEKLAIGLSFEYSRDNHSSEYTPFGGDEIIDLERVSNQFGIGIFSRHIINPQNNLKFFIQPYFQYHLSNQEEKHNSEVESEEKVYYLDIGIGMGLLYQISDKWSATLRMGGLNYINGKWEVVDTNKAEDFSSFRVNASLSTIYLGFEMNL